MECGYSEEWSLECTLKRANDSKQCGGVAVVSYKIYELSSVYLYNDYLTRHIYQCRSVSSKIGLVVGGLTGHDTNDITESPDH